MPVCEGCFTHTDEEHIKRRSERLELAARFLPVRIRVLLLDRAPLVRAEDYFYRVAKDRSDRSFGGRRYFDELMNAATVPASADSQEAALLAEFQRKGFFLSYCAECPFEEQNDPEAALRRVAPTVLKRVQSIDPAYIVPILNAPMDVIRLFGMIGWGDRLVLDNNLPFIDPYMGDPKHRGAIGTALGERIKKALAFLP